MVKMDVRVIVAVGLILFFLVFGTIFFHAIENWSYVDSFYFTGVTLTTVGYGDLTPTHDASKIAAVVFAFLGVGIIFYSISIVARRSFARGEAQVKHVSEHLKKRLS
jgi:voltage-gated potassium channel